MLHHLFQWQCRKQTSLDAIKAASHLLTWTYMALLFNAADIQQKNVLITASNSVWFHKPINKLRIWTMLAIICIIQLFRQSWFQDEGTPPKQDESSLFGFYRRGEDAKNDGNHCEALSENATPHQQLGLSGFSLVEGTEAVQQRSGCCCATYWDEGILLGFPQELFLEALVFGLG